MISKALQNQIEEVLSQPVRNIHPVSGGSINRAAKLTTKAGEDFFLKWNSSAPADMFSKEEKGLGLLRSANCGLRIPQVAGTGGTFLVMEFIQQGKASNSSAEQFGKQLAAMHQNSAERFGLDHDNYIGRLHQSNTKHTTWSDFFIEERLEPQLKMAVDDGKLSAESEKNFHHLFNRLPDILSNEPPALLHGDLWGGNYFYDASGEPVIYDPAVYYGHREIELAFTYLFGGFSLAFYNAYEESYPLPAGFAKERKDIYNLYPLLVHTNLFGGSYARQVKGIVEQF